MEVLKSLGIWMDHSIINFIALDTGKSSHSVTSKFTDDVKEEALTKSEKGMHNKRQQINEAFYRKYQSRF